MAVRKKVRLTVKSRGRQSYYSILFKKISIVGYQQKCYQKKKSQKVAKMGQNYAKYCHISGMLKDPVETFETSRTYREAIHGPSDFILMVKGKFFMELKSLNYKIDAFQMFCPTFHNPHFLQNRLIFSW